MPNDVTQILQSIEFGDPNAAEETPEETADDEDGLDVPSELEQR